MKHSEDIANLFQQFGAKSDSYQEISRQQDRKLSSERWPLVGAVRNAAVADVPSVVRAMGPPTTPAAQRAPSPVTASTPTSGAGRQEPSVFSHAPRFTDREPAAVFPVAGLTPESPHSLHGLTAPSPLGGLAGLSKSAFKSEAQDHLSDLQELSGNLSAVFARLGGLNAAENSSSVPTTSWQPRKARS